MKNKNKKQAAKEFNARRLLPVKTTCPYCNQAIEIERIALSYGKANCPKCGKAITVTRWVK